MLTREECRSLENQINASIQGIELVYTSPSSLKCLPLQEQAFKLSILFALFADGVKNLLENSNDFKEIEKGILDLYAELIFKG